MVIDALRDRRGDVRTILRRPEDAEGLIDISNDSWDSKPEILRGLTFERIRLSGKAIAVNFVDCAFQDCRFERLRSDGHWWAAGNTWTRCTFDEIQLQDVISPSNVFEDCSFKNTRLIGYRPVQTLYARCRFEVFQLEGLKALRAGKATREIPRVAKLGAELAFLESVFVRPTFKNCLFEAVAFEGCEVKEPSVKTSDFRGAIGQPWWQTQEQSEPFVHFLEELVAFIEARFATGSASHKAMSGYLDDYRAGRVKSRDYSAVLYTGTVPDRELDEIEDALVDLEARYPF